MGITAKSLALFLLVLFLANVAAASQQQQQQITGGTKNNANYAIALSGDTPKNGTMRLTLVGKPYTLNQLNSTTDCESCWRIISLEYAYGLPTMPNGSFYFRAGLFDWMSTNSNATVWNFNIRPGAKWSDGTAITSADINFTFGLSSGYLYATDSDFINLLGNVKSLQVINSSETQFVLNHTESDFGNYLSNQYYFTPVPEHVWSPKPNYINDTNFAQDVTSGPFYHLGYNGGPTLVLKANPYYWNPPALSQIVVNFVNSTSEAVAQLQSDQTDLALVNPSSIGSFVNNGSFGINVEPDRSILFLEYNVSQFPFNTDFRQALAYAINTSNIVQAAYAGFATPGTGGRGGIPPSTAIWHNATSAIYPYNVTVAKDVLLGLHYTFDNQGKLHYPSNGGIVNFEIYTDSNFSEDEQSAQIAASDLDALGMNVTVKVQTLFQIESEVFQESGNILQQMILVSSRLPVFGFGSYDSLPAFDSYFPFSVYQPNWITPPAAEAQYYQYLDIVNSSTDQSVVQQAIKNIDGLNSQFLPDLVLAYPDGLWVYRTDRGLSGFPQSGEGFDMGSLTLDPFSFSRVSCSNGPCTDVPTPNTNSSTSTASSSSSSSVATSTGAAPFTPADFLAVSIVAVIAIIVLGTYFSRRKRRQPPPEPPKSG
jgi:ABC-type transport system substrate-binding protein